MAIFIQDTLPPYLFDVKQSLYKWRNWYFTLGLALVIFGMLGIGYAALTTLISVIFVGSLLLAGSIATTFHAAQFWRKSWGYFFLYLLTGILYGIIGLLMLANPVLGATYLTLTLGVFYLVLGASRIVTVFTRHGLPGWGWLVASGVISLILGGMILAYWPIISFWLIGLFVGVDIIFTGWWLVMLSWSTRPVL